MDVTEFKEVYASEGKFCLSAQVPYLTKLAEHYEAIGREDPIENWTSLLKAHSLFNSCSARESEMSEEFRGRAFRIQNEYNIAAGRTGASLSQLEELQRTHCEYLTDVRSKYRSQAEVLLELIETYDDKPEKLDSMNNHHIEREISNKMETMSTECTKDMIGLAEMIIRDSVELMEVEPPCSYAAVAFGSMARLEATPYSDLEFLFLIQDDCSDTVAYFEQLALNVYFSIGNLRETNLKYMDIEELEGWFQDECKNGFKIDGLRSNAGNIPTGNGKQHERNKYICTVSHILERYVHIFENPTPEGEGNDAVVGDESDMMAYLRLITHSGDGEELFKQLTTGINAAKPNKKRRATSKATLEKDILRYDINPENAIVSGSRTLAKSEIYRYPSLLLLNLKIVQSLKSSSTWDTAELLLAQSTDRSPEYEFHKSLLHLLSVSCLIRMASYLYHDGQCERISHLKVSKSFQSSTQFRQWHLPEKLFLLYCIVRNPVQLFLGEDNKEFWLKHKPELRMLSAIKSKTAAQNIQNDEHFKLIPEEWSDKLPFDLGTQIGVILMKSQQYKRSYILFKSLEQRCCKQRREYHQQIAVIALWVITRHLNMKADIMRYEKKLQRLLTSGSLKEPEILISGIYDLGCSGMTSTFNLSLLSKQVQHFDIRRKYMWCFLQKDFPQSLVYLLEDKRAQDEMEGPESISQSKLTLLSRIGKVHRRLGSVDESLKCFKQALIMHFEIYRVQENYPRAELYHLIGQSYSIKQEYSWADKAYRKSLMIFETLYQRSPAIGLKNRILNVYQGLVETHIHLNDPVMAEMYKHEMRRWNHQ